jgi:hypothetical protein
LKKQEREKQHYGFGSKIMKLKNLIIPDGEILFFTVKNEVVEINFRDYQGFNFKIIMKGCQNIEERGSVGISLSKAKIKKDKNKLIWSLYDDDGLVLKIEYREAIVVEN